MVGSAVICNADKIADDASDLLRNADNGETTKLYRGDGRSNEQIFGSGLTPWDSNGKLSLSEHVNSSPSPKTGNQWVSTTKDPNMAASEDFSGPGGYVYEIDGNAPNQVDVNKTLGSDNVNFSYENEVAFPGGVDTCHITGCYTVQPDGSLGNFVPNPNYKVDR